MATGATTAAVWATPRGTATMATRTTTTTICAAARGATAVEPATTLLCPTTAVSPTTTMGNATTLSTNGYAKRLVNYTPFVYFPGILRCSSFLYWPHCNRFDSTFHIWWVRYLVAY